MHVYERIRNNDKLIQGDPKKENSIKITIKSFELTPERALTLFTIIM